MAIFTKEEIDINKALGTVFLFSFAVLLASCLIPNQQSDALIPAPTAHAGANQAVVVGTRVTLDGSGSMGATGGGIAGYLWEFVGSTPTGASVDLSGGTTDTAMFTAPNFDTATDLEFRLTVTGSNGKTASATVNIIVSLLPLPLRADVDGDGLIEISTLEALHNMRYNLRGTSYKTNASDTGNAVGCPRSGCFGYELTQNLDFDADGDGKTWTGNSEEGFTLDAGDDNDAYFDVQAGGWEPIGTADPNGSYAPSIAFTATFEGNGHTISNLAIQSDTAPIGFFGYAYEAHIRNIGLIDNLTDYTGSSDDIKEIGGLLGKMYGGSIVASYATGNVSGGAGDFEVVGGLVGYQISGSIAASYAAGTADGGAGAIDVVGGLVGWQLLGTIIDSHATGTAGGDIAGGLLGILTYGDVIDSYATATVNGGSGGRRQSIGGLVGSSEGNITASYATGAVVGNGEGDNAVGGLVGRLVGVLQTSSIIIASYATGNADGGGGDSDAVGGLVGWQENGSITASYATGNADGGGGDSDAVGGLVGQQEAGSITASYAATGLVDGGDGTDDEVGALLGNQDGGNITASYGFGSTARGETVRSEAMLPAGISTAIGLTASNAGSQWNPATWDFGTASQAPVLKYKGAIIPGQGR